MAPPPKLASPNKTDFNEPELAFDIFFMDRSLNGRNSPEMLQHDNPAAGKPQLFSDQVVDPGHIFSLRRARITGA
jgi:hypothetical protein